MCEPSCRGRVCKAFGVVNFACPSFGVFYNIPLISSDEAQEIDALEHPNFG